MRVLGFYKMTLHNNFVYLDHIAELIIIYAIVIINNGTHSPCNLMYLIILYACK